MSAAEGSDLVYRLLQPIDASRPHDVSELVAWHGRVMVLAWGLMAPVAVLAARYFKILPWQNWPRVLDNPTWWHIHWKGQAAVVLLTIAGLGLILMSDHAAVAPLHARLGYALVVLGAGQALSGLLRGTKGGPTAPAPDGSLRGDHFDMTPRRLAFERWHKTVGYGLILLAMLTVLLGLWAANAPLWMWATLLIWWLALLGIALFLEWRVGSYDTYQAIWGPDPDLPGNRMAYRSFRAVRPGDRDRLWFRKRTGTGRAGER